MVENGSKNFITIYLNYNKNFLINKTNFDS